ncbi:MAG: phosphonate ABC transporter ATP-binding protein [Thiohalocapsa sp.]
MITLIGLQMTYANGFEALCPVDLAFEPASFNVLLGPSGAGKSTLLRCVNLLNMPTGGTVEVQGVGCVNRDRSLQRRHRRATAMIFQQHQLIRRHSALQNVLMGRLGHYHPLRTLFPFSRADKLLALESLDRVGLIDKALERIDNLSGGQQQRVGIARGLTQQPSIMLADEPVASLDPSTSDKVLSLLQRICREDGLTALVSLHQVELAKKYGDRIVGLAEGRVVFDGTADALDEETITDIYRDGAADSRAEDIDTGGQASKEALAYRPP